MGALLVGGVCVALRDFNVEPDVWWHIKVGETILRTHRVPIVDPYSFTVPGAPWIAYEWLGDVLLAFASRLGGLRALDLLFILLGSAILLALYAYAAIRSGNSKAAIVTSAVLLFFTTVSFSLRPQMLSYLFLILTLIALERFRQGKTRALWFLPFIFLVWVNTHGLFLAGLVAMCIYWASGLAEFRVGGLNARRWTPAERLRLELVFLLSLVALVVTPYGTELAVYPLDMAFKQPLVTGIFLEWKPMSFGTLGGKVFLALVLSLLLAQVALRLTWRLEELVLFLFGITMALLHVRFLLLFVPFLVPVLSTILARWVPPYDRAKDRPVLNAVLMTLVVAALVGYFPSRQTLERKVAEHFPVQAVDYLRRNAVPGPMFNTFEFGGYLIGSLGPAHKVFIDGRADIYQRGGVLADYLHIVLTKPGALAILDGYHVQSCLINQDTPLATLLTATGKWRVIYQDGMSMLFVRRGALGSPNLEKRP